ncbi:hypothetical protein CCUS01_16638, partial [Colletotrichum cuscutae]
AQPVKHLPTTNQTAIFVPKATIFYGLLGDPSSRLFRSRQKPSLRWRIRNTAKKGIVALAGWSVNLIRDLGGGPALLLLLRRNTEAWPLHPIPKAGQRHVPDRSIHPPAARISKSQSPLMPSALGPVRPRQASAGHTHASSAFHYAGGEGVGTLGGSSPQLWKTHSEIYHAVHRQPDMTGSRGGTQRL